MIMDIILLLSLAWCGREDGVVRVRTYHLLQAGLLGEPCLARDAHMRVKFVSERRSLALKEMEMLGGEAADAHGPSQLAARLRPLTRRVEVTQRVQDIVSGGVHNDK